MNINDSERIAVSPSEAAKMLGIGLPKMYQLTHMAGFPSIKIGRRVLIPVESLKTWLETQAQNHES